MGGIVKGIYGGITAGKANKEAEKEDSDVEKKRLTNQQSNQIKKYSQ